MKIGQVRKSQGSLGRLSAKYGIFDNRGYPSWGLLGNSWGNKKSSCINWHLRGQILVTLRSPKNPEAPLQAGAYGVEHGSGRAAHSVIFRLLSSLFVPMIFLLLPPTSKDCQRTRTSHVQLPCKYGQFNGRQLGRMADFGQATHTRLASEPLFCHPLARSLSARCFQGGFGDFKNYTI